MIGGHTVTNTLEAVENSLANGIKYIELDLLLTSDSVLVATHDWSTYSSLSGVEASDTQPPSYARFINSTILDSLTVLDYARIDSIFKANKDAYLVTDKLTDISVLDRFLPDIKNRTIVECFTPRQYSDCLAGGFHSAMRSYHNYSDGGINALNISSTRFKYLHTLPTVFAVFSGNIIDRNTADSIFKAEPAVRYVYVDDVSAK